MKTRWIMPLLIIIPIVLAACSRDTTVTFSNNAECGTATITLRNTDTGNERSYTLEQGRRIEIDVDNGISYRYEVIYERLPNATQCDPKSGTFLLPAKGNSVSFSLNSVTPTPAAESPTPPGG